MSNLVSASIANLINGVSQQPNALRLASQCELQENCNSSVVDGLGPRNPTRHVKQVTTSAAGNTFGHLINRDVTERYRLIISAGVARVFDMNGVAKTVNVVGSAEAYIATATPAEDLVAMTVADYTFILNKKVTVRSRPDDLVPARPKEAIVWIRTSGPKVTYRITVDGHSAVRTTGDNTTPESQATDNIAQVLIGTSALADATGFGSPGMLGPSGSVYNYAAPGSLIYISRVDGTDFSIAVTDSLGDSGTNLVKGKTQRFTNLPARGYPGFKTEVQGEGSSFSTSYWVEFVTDASNPYGGVWKETCKPSERRALDASTMPHVLVREADGTFTLKPADWDKRKVGDVTESNPFPSFVDRTINDIFFHRNRLGFLSGENMIMSVSGSFFDFFKGSAIQVLDTDPIDIAASNTKVAILNHAVPWNETLLLVSDQTQFMLGKTNDILTVKNASLDPTTQFECSKAAKPIAVGNYVYFVQNRNDYSLVREFAVDEYTQAKDAQDITSHVPKYIPAGVFKLAASNTENIIVALSHFAPNVIFVYQYYYANGTKLQSAWHKWTLGAGDTVLSADFIESDLHLLVGRSDGIYMEKMTVTPNLAEGSLQATPRLDRMLDETQITDMTYNPVNNTTGFSLPFIPPDGEEWVLIAWDGNPGYLSAGRKVDYTRTGTSIVANGGNLAHFRFGRVMKARYRFSQFMVREQAPGGGQNAVGEGRINIRRLALTHGRSGYFRVEVTPQGRGTFVNIMNGRKVGQLVLGLPAMNEGVFKVPIMGRNTELTVELVSDEYLPFSILSADWEGIYTIRSRRI